MARQTRSSNAASTSSPTTTTKATSTPTKSTRGTGKRKRASLADTEQQQPVLKQRRSESGSVRASVEAQTPKGKEEDLDEALTTENEDNDMDNEDVDEEEGTTGVKHEDETKEVEQKSVGDLPLYEKDASMLLDVLEMMDSQGLLDRVFPLPTSSPSNPQSISLRTALQDSQTYPIRIIRAAITHLLPLHTHPRSRPSAASTQQLRFCQQALQLLDTASKRVCPVPPLSALSSDSNTALTFKSKSERAPPQYALLQRLPTGEWWTSLAHTSTAALKGKTGHAELVSIVPTPSAPVASSSTIPNTSDSDLTVKLKSLTLRTTPRRPVIAMTWPRRLSAGTFTTYNASHGPYASFAPSYDAGGAELGRSALGLLAWDQSRRREMRSVAMARLKERLQASMHTEQETASIQTSEESMQVDTRPSASDAATVEDQVDATTALSGLLPDSEIEGIQSVVDQLGKEEIIADLLHRNARALDRLQGLQLARLAGPNGGLSEPEVGSEEWETAQTITETLALLTSLRPRLGATVTPTGSSIPLEQDSQASADTGDKPFGALTPTPASLHALQRSLPTTAQPGWHGTLPPSKPKALRDDRTMLVRPPPAPVPLPPAASVNPASVPLPSSRTPSVPGTPGIGGRAGSVGVPPQQLPHTQASVQQQYVQPQPTAQGAYPYAAYTQYTTNGYTYPAHLQMTAPTQPTTPAGAPGQQGYANYGYAAQAATYASYWAAQQAQGGIYGQPQQAQTVVPPAQAQGQGQRPPAVVANTVQAQGQGWGQGQAQAQQVQGRPVPVLPPHLLSAGSTSTPGTPVSVGR